MTKSDAVKKLGFIIENQDWGAFSTGMCVEFGISFESFLRFSQISDSRKGFVLKTLYRVVTDDKDYLNKKK